jgi:hypothetical protein
MGMDSMADAIGDHHPDDVPLEFPQPAVTTGRLIATGSRCKATEDPHHYSSIMMVTTVPEPGMDRI